MPCRKEQYRVTPGGIPYVLTRKRVKNLNMRLRPDGQVAVSAPARAAASRACSSSPSSA